MTTVSSRVVMPLAALAAFSLSTSSGPADEGRYRRPPQAILDVLRARPLPVVFVSPARDAIVLATPLRYPPIAELARPMLRLAGMRIDPQSNGIHHAPSVTSYEIVRIADGRHIPVTLPANAHAGPPIWSPDGARFAFWNATPNAIELYLATVATGKFEKVRGVRLNPLFGEPIQWRPDGRQLLVYAIPPHRRSAPATTLVPTGPVSDETRGVKAPAVTFEDLLQNAHDADVWDYYAGGIYTLIDIRTGLHDDLTKLPQVWRSAMFSPDGRHLLMDRILHPYSYAAPSEAFGHRLFVVDLMAKNRPQRLQAAIPLQTNVTFDVVPTGPRDVSWRADKPATLVWAEAQDGGDPAKAAAIRDILYEQDLANVTNPLKARAIISLPDRFRGIEFVERSALAFVREYDRNTRFTRTLELDLSAPSPAPLEVANLRDGDRYHDPGHAIREPAPNGESVDVRDGNAVYLQGAGVRPDGRRPFIDRFDLTTHAKTRIFESALAPLEEPLALLDLHGSHLLLQRQSSVEAPNEVVWTRDSKSERALTAISDPAPILRTLGRRVVTYKRADGVDLSFTLYLPPGYKEGTRLPTFIWAYPAEFNDPAVAAQATNSAQTFVVAGGASQIFVALAGYAVLDNAAVPIVGDPNTVNDTFVEQLTADAQAAIDKAVALGVTDRDRVAVGGHSYGAFMTANLLAHTRFFRAGIARSGAYNRSLTPFGFQSERRTYWEATDLYTKISPFTYADKIVDPLLLIHGMADDNAGTFPIQSERFFAAIKGNGGTARLVMLPYEAHGYVARESIETTLAEMIDWLNRYVKNAAPRPSSTVQR